MPIRIRNEYLSTVKTKYPTNEQVNLKITLNGEGNSSNKCI